MLKLFGGLMVVLGVGALGFGKVSQMNREIKILRGLVGALEGMEGEISFQLTPMPALFGGLSRRMAEPLQSFFRHLSEGMTHLEERDMGALWREEVSTLPLSPKVGEVLAELGDVLGRYDGERQVQAISRTRGDLTSILHQLEGERTQKSKMYATLALTAGVLVVILLI